MAEPINPLSGDDVNLPPGTEMDTLIAELVEKGELESFVRGLKADRLVKHMGPGPHPSGSPQSVHASGRKGHGITRQDALEIIENKGGFTVDVATGEQPTSGYAVAFEEFERKFPPGSLTARKVGKYRAEHWNQFANTPGAKWGAWKDTDGWIYFDISVVDDDLDKMVEIGREFNQKAIYHLDTGQTIRLDDDGSSLSDFRDMLADVAEDEANR